MPSLNLEVSHALDQEEATRRLKDRFGEIKEKHAGQVSDLEERWNGNTLEFSFKTFGIQIKGTAVSGPSEVKIQTQLPLTAMMFKSTIEQQLGDELRSLLG